MFSSIEVSVLLNKGTRAVSCLAKMDLFWKYSLLFVLIYMEILLKGSDASRQKRLVGSNRNCESSDKIQDQLGEYDFMRHISRNRDFCLFLMPKSMNALTINFLDFNIGYEHDDWNCTNFVEITSYEENQESHRKRYCGSRDPPTYTSQYGSIIVIWFHRKYSLPNTKLLIHYSAPAPKCGGSSVISSYTFITSPQFPSFSPPQTQCDWSVTLHYSAPNSALLFQLTSWNSDDGARLELFSGDKTHFIASFDDTTSQEYARKVFMLESSGISINFYSGSQTSSSFNATVKVKGYCIPGTYPCGDGLNCYTQSQLCDSNQDCSTGYDELGCAGCDATQFWCGREDNNCYSAAQRCNAFKDCIRSMADEANCKTCGPGSFLCKSEAKCIYESWRCDSENDCHDRSDEEDCSYTASRRVITAAVIGSLVCSLLLVIALGCTCKLYSLRASHHRHPHHQYRATPLTRVERELFQRQAPPTYDMMLSGAPTEAAANPRVQRQRRRRNRRYQFQRAAPANNIGHQTNRAEGTDSGNSQVTTPTQTNTTVQNNQNSSTYVVDSVPELLAEMMFGTSRGSLTPNPVLVTKDSGTQTSMNTNNDSRGSGENPSTSDVPRQSSSTSSSSSSSRRSTRSFSGNRSRSRRSTHSSTSTPTTTSNTANSKDQQAKPLPKKKRILPVMVQAPHEDSVVEEDTLACVYPCPPSYSQAVASDDVKINTDLTEVQQDEDSISSSTVENEIPQQDALFDTENESLTTTKSKFFPFSIARAFRSIASTSLSKFQKNPYTQMTTQRSTNDVSNQEYPTVDSTNNDGQQSVVQRQLRPSTSSDESMLDCAMETVSLGPNNELLDMTSRNNTAQAMTSGNMTQSQGQVNISADVFLQRNTRNQFKLDVDNDSLHMEDF